MENPCDIRLCKKALFVLLMKKTASVCFKWASAVNRHESTRWSMCGEQLQESSANISLVVKFNLRKMPWECEWFDADERRTCSSSAVRQSCGGTHPIIARVNCWPNGNAGQVKQFVIASAESFGSGLINFSWTFQMNVSLSSESAMTDSTSTAVPIDSELLWQHRVSDDSCVAVTSNSTTLNASVSDDAQTPVKEFKFSFNFFSCCFYQLFETRRQWRRVVNAFDNG